jgi:circadian clock protein KaiC
MINSNNIAKNTKKVALATLTSMADREYSEVPNVKPEISKTPIPKKNNLEKVPEKILPKEKKKPIPIENKEITKIPVKEIVEEPVEEEAVEEAPEEEIENVPEVKKENAEEKKPIPIENKEITKIPEVKKEKASEISKAEVKKSEVKTIHPSIPQVKQEGKKPKIDMATIAKEIKEEQIKAQRGPVEKTIGDVKDKTGRVSKRYVKTGIEGFDELLVDGIPRGSTLLVAGGAGSGKTIFCLQTLMNKTKEGKKCLYMSFEEKEEKLIEHMEGLGWNPQEMIKKGLLQVQRTNPFDITRNVDALLAKQKGELLIDIDPVIIPRDFKPDFIFLDSLTAIASAFTGKEESYRIYIEQLFRFFEKIGATSFLVTETEQIPKIFSKSGVEEFLADGVIVMYNLKQRNVRENAIEILKLRGAGHQKKIVALQITPEGIVIYPQQEVFSEIE